jgi:hypothetical protein
MPPTGSQSLVDAVPNDPRAPIVDARARQVPVLGLSVEEACGSLGVSWDFWRANVEPDVRIVRVGRRKIVPVSALQEWLDKRAEAVSER